MENIPEYYGVDRNIIEKAYNRCFPDELAAYNITTTVLPSNTLHFCPRTFDGWSCWNETPAGHVARGPCPDFIVGFDSKRKAHKVCMADGEWFRHPDTNASWSNYTSCVDTDDLALRQRVNNIYTLGYSVSLVALVLSILVFFSFRALKCTRITIHKNLFLSFIINNAAWILWYTAILKEEVLQTNTVGCQILHVLLQYFLVCNYFWMFCEGLYLHTLLVFAFVDEDGILKWFYVIGWVTPIVPTGIYAAVRSSFPKDTTICWSDYDSPYTWILSTPVCASMLGNLIFLINIVRVLVTKLRAVNSPDVNQTRKAVRATLILIPLLGLHYLVTPFRPNPGAPGEEVYEMISAVVTSFQGLCVACLFCFFNGEVIGLVMRRWNQKRSLNTRTYSMAGNTTVSKFNYWKRQFGDSSDPRTPTPTKDKSRSGSHTSHNNLEDGSQTLTSQVSRNNSQTSQKLEDVVPRWW